MESGTEIYVELEYDLVKERLVVKCRAATIAMEGAIFAGALEGEKQVKTTPLPADKIARVAITYDMATDDCKVVGQGPRVITLGVLMHALGALTRNQLTQMFQKENNAILTRIQHLEMQPSRKLILP